MNNLIGLSGKKGSGKDLVTRIIQIIDYNPELNTREILKYIDDTDYDYIDGTYKNKKFAYKLKKITCDLTGITMEQLENSKYKGMTVSEFTGMDWSWEKDGEIVDYTFRQWLQLIGTDCMRNIIHPDIWVKSLFADYKYEEKPTGITFNDDEHKVKVYPKWVISDVRFPNEADAIKDRDGIVIRINRPQKGKNVDEHFSETALDDYDNFDYIIKNDGTIEDLIEKIREIL